MKRWKNAAKNAAIFIGLFGGIITIPKAALEQWRALFPQATIEVRPNQPLNLTYRPDSHLLTCSFGILLSNSGNKNAYVQTRGAHLDVKGDSSKVVPFTEKDVTMKEGQDRADTIELEQGMPAKQIACEITTTLSEPLPSNHVHQVLTEDEGNTHRELVVEFSGEDRKSHAAVFHFEYDPVTETQLFSPPSYYANFLGSDINEI